MAPSKAEYIRDLDSNEKFVDACAVTRNLFCAGALSIKTTTKQAFKFEDLEEALSRFQKNHLELQVTIKRKSQTAEKGWNPLNLIKKPKSVPKVEYWTVPNASVPLQWVQVGKNDKWEKLIVEHGLQATFEEGQLLWRAFYVDQSKIGNGSQEGAVIFICHCAIADGRGLQLLLDDFAEEFDKVLAKHPSTPKENKMIAPLLDLLDEKFKQPNTWADSIKIGLYMASCMFVKNRSIYIARNPIPLVPDYTTRNLVFDVPKELSTQLLKKLKVNDISISGLITAAGMAALHQIVRTSKDEKLKFHVTHEVDVRTFCKDYDKLRGRIDGCRCTYMETSLDGSSVNKSTELWDLAAVAHADIIPKLSSPFQGKMCKAFADMGGNAYEIFGSSMGTATIPRNDFSVAIYDDLDDIFGERDNFEINRTFGGVSAFSMGSPFGHCIEVFKGRIYYTLMYHGNFVKLDQAQEYGERTLAYLKMAAE